MQSGIISYRRLTFPALVRFLQAVKAIPNSHKHRIKNNMENQDTPASFRHEDYISKKTKV